MTRIKVTASVVPDGLHVNIAGGASLGSLVYDAATLHPFTEVAASAPHLVEFFELFLAFYSADRLLKRVAGRWQRRLLIEFPVTRLAAWKACVPTLQRLVWQSTGDDVEFDFVQRRSAERHRDARAIPFVLEEPRPTSVVLLSDGLDSLCGAFQHLRSHPEERVCFVSLVTNSRKDARIATIRRHLKATRTSEIAFRESHLHLCDPPRSSGQELSQRSRTMLAIGAGLVVAAGYGAPGVVVSENGIGILNLPLPGLQMDHHSSQVLHPANRSLWSELSALLLNAPGDVIYPNRFRTKGEMCAELPKEALHLISSTSSCDRPQRHDAPADCGRCGSCVLRRTALSVAGLSHCDTSYTARPWSSRPDRVDAADVQSYHASLLGKCLAESDPWTALVRFQPTLVTTLKGEPDEQLSHMRAATMSLLRRHVSEVLSLECAQRAS